MVSLTLTYHFEIKTVFQSKSLSRIYSIIILYKIILHLIKITRQVHVVEQVSEVRSHFSSITTKESKVEKSRVRRNEKSEVKSSKTKEGTQGFRFLEKLTRKRMKRNTAEIINEVVRGDLKVSSSKYSVELRFNYRNIFLFFVS